MEFQGLGNGAMTPNPRGGWDRRSDDKRLGDLERGFDVLRKRVDDHDDWVEESKEHHLKVNAFITKFDAIEAERDKRQKERHEQNSWKLNFIGVCVAIATAIIGAVGAYVAWKAATQHAFLEKMMSKHEITISQYNAQE